MWLYVIVAVLIAAVLVSLFCQFGCLPQKQNGASSQETSGSTGGQSGGASSQETSGSYGGPCIYATLAFSNETGFVTTVHPASGTIEFVLLPNSVGEFTVTYTGINFNNLTMPIFNPANQLGNIVAVWNVLSNGTLGIGSSLCPYVPRILSLVPIFYTRPGLSVTESSVTWVSYYQVVVDYTATSGGSDGLYMLGLPSTCLSTIIDVGTQPYAGPLTWLDGVIY